MSCRRWAWFAWPAVALALACSHGVEPAGAHADEQDEHHEHDPHDEDETVSEVTLSPEAYRAAGITVASAELRSLGSTVRVTGTLSYDERDMAVATARVGGRIARVEADYGERVAASEPLAWIDSPELAALHAELSQAAALMELREAELERARLLSEGQAISRGELERREADWRSAVAALETATQKLDLVGLTPSGSRSSVYPVRSPIAGRVTERRAIPGSVVTADEELFTVAELDRLWLFLQIFEKDLPAVVAGSVVTLTCEAHPEDRFRGRIDFVGEVLDPHTRTATARAVIDNDEGELKPGMFVYATIEPRAGGEDSSRSLAVPVSAVTQIDGRDVVFVRSRERSFAVRPVALGEMAGDWVEVREGLGPGAVLAVTGVFTLKSEILEGGLQGHHH